MPYEMIKGRVCALTSRPFQHDADYAEYAPCDALKPYIRCFWTAWQSGEKAQDFGGARDSYAKRLVIPDLCADIIFTGNPCENAVFCGVSDVPFYSERSTPMFGIRFYAWTAAFFSETSLGGTMNAALDAREIFGKAAEELSRALSEEPVTTSTARKIARSEEILLRFLRSGRESTLVGAALCEIAASRGICRTRELAQRLFVSERQLQRVTAEYTGLSPKKLSELVRYQLLWRDILTLARFDAAEKALEYGYSDQSHMLRDFRRFHDTVPRLAREAALPRGERVCPKSL